MGARRRVRRGTILIGQSPGDFTSKARPYVVVQADVTLETSTTVTVCPLTTTLIGIGRVRIAISPTPGNGLDEVSEIEVDRITTMRRTRFDAIVGTAAPEIMNKVDASLRRWLAI